MTHNVSNKAFLYIMLASIGILLLAAVLPELQLTDGLPFPGAVEGQAPGVETSEQVRPATEGSILLWVQGVLAFGLLLLLGACVCLIIVPKNRVWIRPVLTALAVLVVSMILVAFLRPMPGGALAIYPDRVYTAPSSAITTSPLGAPPAWLFWLVVAGLALLVVFFGFWLFRQAFSRSQTTSPVVQEAESALAAIQAGTDLPGVIVRCYLRMNQAILEEQGMVRDETLTPREFETFMAAKGVPVEPMRALTRLFEAVRYGRKPVDQQAEETAVACLTAIIQYCQVGATRQ